MSAIRDPEASEELPRLTLLDLVATVTEIADGERETVAIVTNLLHSGRIRLDGAFRESHFARMPPGDDDA